MNQAGAQELQIVAVADRNEISGAVAAVAAGEANAVLVISAVQLSTAQGHLLCYSPMVEALARFYSRLTLADRGSWSRRLEWIPRLSSGG